MKLKEFIKKIWENKMEKFSELIVKEEQVVIDEEKQVEIFWIYRNVYIYRFGMVCEMYCQLFVILLLIDVFWKKIVIMSCLKFLLFFFLIFVIIFRVQFYYQKYKYLKK